MQNNIPTVYISEIYCCRFIVNCKFIVVFSKDGVIIRRYLCIKLRIVNNDNYNLRNNNILYNLEKPKTNLKKKASAIQV
jgi:hypothetical protein